MAGNTNSPSDSPTENQNIINEGKTIKLTINSVMQGVKETQIYVGESTTIQNLKITIEAATEVAVDKQVLLFNGKELKNDQTLISEYGIKDNSVLTMNVKMNTGVVLKPTATEMIFLVPEILPSGNHDELRKTIKGMNTVHRKPKKMSEMDETARIWTPEKQLEAELTRNRMKTLLRRRKTSSSSANGTPVDSGASSVQSYSPVATPPSELASPLPLGTNSTKITEVEEAPVTIKDLKLFFDPPETIEEFKRSRKNLYLPPSNENELNAYLKRFEEDRRTKCNYCMKKLSAAQQTMLCKCHKLFCDRHRLPNQHMCYIDYKEDGRNKLRKESSKVGDGGARKAQYNSSESAAK